MPILCVLFLVVLQLISASEAPAHINFAAETINYAYHNGREIFFKEKVNPNDPFNITKLKI